jgi:hypothetical protein
MLTSSGFQRDAKWERRFQIPNQISLISTACVPLRPNEGDEAEARKLTVFDQQAMRRTAWDYIWVDVNLADIQAQLAILEALEEKGKQPEHPDSFHWNPTSPAKMVDGKTSSAAGVDETSHWGIEGVGVKVWLRRTIIYQLINLVERIVL